MYTTILLMLLVVLNLAILLILLQCCKGVKGNGGPGGGGTPIPILGTVWDNTPTKGAGCAMDPADSTLGGWEVKITPVGAAAPLAPPVFTSGTGEYMRKVPPGDYVVEVVIPAGSTLAPCPGMPNPRHVTVPTTGSAIVNFSLQT